MASYWKSQPKKFCDVCKCWLGDNKATIEFHERGKSHQEKKKKQLEQIKKRGMQQAKDNANSHRYLEEMERAAKKKYLQDLKEQGVKVSEDEYKKREQATKAAVFKPFSGFPKHSTPSTIKKADPVQKIQNTVATTQSSFKLSEKHLSSSQNRSEVVFSNASQPYGKWTTVENPAEVSHIYTAAKTESSSLQFTEKRVATGSLDKTEPVSFKKRKTNNRSIRTKPSNE